MLTTSEEYIAAALLILRPAEPYGRGLGWIADARAAVSHLVAPSLFRVLLLNMAERGLVELRRADMVDGVAGLVAASELQYLTECWHYVGLTPAGMAAAGYTVDEEVGS